MSKVKFTIDVPITINELDLQQLEIFSKFVTELPNRDKDNKMDLSEIIALSSSENEKEIELANKYITYVAALTSASTNMVKGLSKDTLNHIQNALGQLIVSLVEEIQGGKSVSNFTIKKSRLQKPKQGHNKLDFMLLTDVQKYPAVTYTKASQILEICAVNPITGLRHIHDLVTWLAYLRPMEHPFNEMFTKDMHLRTIYDMDKFAAKKELLGSLNAKTAIRVYNFFLRKQTLSIHNTVASLKHQQKPTASRAANG